MSSNEQNDINPSQDEINLKEIFLTLIDQKIVIAMITIFFALASIAFSLNESEKWYSSALLSPVSANGGGNSSKTSGLASMVGISTKGTVSSSSKASATITSRDFLNHLITFEGVLENLMAFQSYDKSSQISIFNSNIFDTKLGKWKDGRMPSKGQAFIAYKSMLSIRIDKFTNLITISIQHGSPKFAKEFLDLIIQEVNNLSRNRDLEKSQESLEYLYGQLNSVQQSDVRMAVTQLIEGQLKKEMMAYVAKNYILQPVDSPYIPEMRSYPQRTRIVVSWTLIGFLLSLIFVISRHYLIKNFK
jgi:LPS O-antigen subunit length determinant protein (WzzB/FepE family)